MSRRVLNSLKRENLNNADVQLAVIKEYKRDRVSQYDIDFVRINGPLQNRLRNIVIRKIENSNEIENYNYDAPEPEEDLVNTISYEETDFFRIMEQLVALNPEEDMIEDVNELVKAKAYVIILRVRDEIKVVGFKTLPENWKMKRAKGLIPLFWNEDRFEDLEQENVFSISNTIDFLYYNEMLFILSKRNFEQGLNFREGMINKADLMYQEVRDLNLFVNMEILTARVGNNQRYLRKIATIRNLGHYQNPQFLQRMREIVEAKGWNIGFENGQIVFTDETLDDILTLLQNKRLHSLITEEDFDVTSVKLI